MGKDKAALIWIRCGQGRAEYRADFRGCRHFAETGDTKPRSNAFVEARKMPRHPLERTSWAVPARGVGGVNVNLPRILLFTVARNS